MKDIVHTYTGDQVQTIELRTPSGLILQILYNQKIRKFRTYLIKRVTPRELARGKSSLVVHTNAGEQNQLPSTPAFDDGQVFFCLGESSVNLHPKSIRALHEWLVHLNRLHQLAGREASAQPAQGGDV